MNREHIHLTLVGSPTLGEELLLGGLEGLDPLKQLIDEGLIDDHQEASVASFPEFEEVAFNQERHSVVNDLEWAKSGLVKNLANLSALELQNEYFKRLALVNEAALRLGYYQKDLHTYFSLDLN